MAPLTGSAAVVAAHFLHGAAAMVRPKKHVAASRQNGSRAAKKKTFTRVPVLDALPYEDDPEGSTMTVDYRPKAKKGYFYEDELRRVAFLHIEEKRDKRRRDPPPPKDAKSYRAMLQEFDEQQRVNEKKAVETISKLNKDSGSKARRLASFAKRAGKKFMP